ncbi:MAG: thioredoxin domain-containing protein [Magnetococcales bacterium]|nr:thioredoxin domain-containing protein [Magnetococcales bacterium]
MSATNKKANRLINETSPYLLQHAYNPVNWYPWGDEALTKAKKEGKIILVSIGYAACHWCHVMERESFENHATADILNRHFVAIKVDREERPDLDGHFMGILTTLTGSGGWPMNMFLTPDLQPIYGGTYFPPEARHNLPSFNGVLLSLQEQWGGNRDEMLKNLAEIQKFLSKKLAPTKSGPAVKGGKDPRQKGVEFWQGRFDLKYGGIGDGTKFPQPSILSFILRRAATTNSMQIAKPALLTLDKMAAGGVRDQLGGSFHRYSVDRYWQVPHFEIMLYDNALLARTYLEAFLLTNQSSYRFIARQILDDMLNRFVLDSGCFISALDADSDGEEGLYYTWDEEEVMDLLDGDAEVEFIDDFVDPVEGTIDGRSVLRLLSEARDIEDTFLKHKGSIEKLLRVRKTRESPARDDKILTSWNSLMISALAKGGRILDEPRYLKAAQRCMADLLQNSFVAGKPRHSRRGDKIGDVVFLDDYAQLIQALLDLYESDYNLNHLETAHRLAGEMLDRFGGEPFQPLPLTPKDQPSDIPAQVFLNDGVTPSGNSSALVALHRLALFSSDERFEEESSRRVHNLGSYMADSPASSPELLWSLDFGPETAKEVIIVGPLSNKTTKQLIKTVNRNFLPGMVLAVVDDKTEKSRLEKWPMLNRTMIDERPTAYVCKNLVCRLPVFTTEDLQKMLVE